MLERDAADIVTITKEDGTVIHAGGVQILNERGEYSATLGCLPPWVRPYMKVSTKIAVFDSVSSN